MKQYNKLMYPKKRKSRMSRVNFLIVLIFGLIALFYSSCSTTMKITEGSLGFLKGQEKLRVVLNFDDAMLQGKPEKTYLAMEQPQWVERWEAAKSSSFKENLYEHLNKNVHIQCGDYPDAQYQATVRVLSVKRKGIGKYLEGPGTREVTCMVIFTKTGDPKPLAKIKAKGDSQGKSSPFAPKAANTAIFIAGAVGGNNQLTGRAFGYVGQDLGRVIAKKSR